MKAVILVGGEGTRLRPLTYDRPKPMVPIVNKPFMEHLVDHLCEHGIREIVFALGYKSDAFASWFGDGSRFGARFWYEVEKVPLGTAGPVKAVGHLLDDTFLVFNGDVLSDIDLTALIAEHRARKAVASLALTPVDDPSSYGVVVTGEQGRVQAFIEKPPRDQAPSNLINAGVYVLEPRVLDFMGEAGTPCSFERQVFPALVAGGENICASATQGYWLDIGSPSRYLQANHDIVRGIKKARMQPAGEGAQWIGANTTIAPDAILEGPMWIGAGVTVESGARLQGPLVLGERVHVGAGCEVAGAVIWEDTHVAARAVLRDCLIGRACQVGEGARMDQEAALGSHQQLAPAAHLASGVRQPA